VNNAIDVCIKTDEEYYVEHRIVLPDGKIKWVSESGDVQCNSDGEPISMFGLVKDIDSRKKAEFSRKKLEQQLQQSQKMESIGQLTGGIAHDFNNMLASITGFTELSLQNDVVKSSDTVKNYLSEVLSASNRARDLVSQMLAFSRNEDSEKEIVDISLLVKESLKMLESILTASIQINYKVEYGKMLSSVNAVQVHQIVMNLCINARDAMNGSGSLFVDIEKVNVTTQQQQKCSSCHMMLQGKFIKINIRDTGGGISQAISERIFEPFFTTKEVGKGTGMGLSMVHGLVHGTEGHIIFESTLGEGTSFSILFPAVDDDTQVLSTDIKMDEVVRADSKGLKVLIVDDEISIGKFLVELLSTRGIRAEMENSVMIAVERLNNRQTEFDLVIVDQTMPGMTGIELIQKIREINTDIKFILMTGFHESVNEEVAMKAGCVAFIKKPFDISSIFSLVEEMGRDNQTVIY